MRAGGGRVVAALVIVLAGCAVEEDAGTPLVTTPRPTPSREAPRTPEEPQVLVPGGPTGRALVPGVYVTARFRPAITFRVEDVPRGGWSLDLDVPDLLALGKEGFAFLSFLRPAQVINALTGKRMRAPADFVAWFQNHPYLEVREPTPATVGGIEGTRLEVARVVPAETHPCPPAGSGQAPLRCVAIAPISDGSPFIFAVDTRASVTVLEVDGESIIVIAEDDDATYDEFLPEAERLLESVEFAR